MRLAALTALLFLSFTSRAQTATSSAVVNVAGNSSTNGTLAIDWRVGEMALVSTMVSTTYSPSSGVVVITNGLLQPEIPTANNSHLFAADELKVLPNLTTGQVEIHFLTKQQGTVMMQVYDANGKLVRVLKAVSSGFGNVEKLDLSSCAAGTYFLKVDLNPYLGSAAKSGSYKIVRI